MNDDELCQQAEAILHERAFINSLSLEEEQGRRKGGRRNVEAALLLGAKIGARSQQQSNTRELQEKVLKDFAIKENIWISAETVESWTLINGGMEARIYDNGENVLKVGYNYLNFYETPLDWLSYKISLHNYIFSGTNVELELIGFTETYGAVKEVAGTFFAPVYKQKYIKGSVLTDDELLLLADDLKQRGFTKVANRHEYYNQDYIIKDLHNNNVLIDNNGNFHFIDTVPFLNTPNSEHRGKREYGDGKVRDSIILKLS